MTVSFLYPLFLWLLLLAPLFVALGWPQKSATDRGQRWLGLALRLLILVALVLGLAGAQLQRPVESITTVFVLDVSDSIPTEAQSQAESFLRQSLAEKPAEDRAAVILFGGEPLVEQLPTSSGAMPGLSSIPLKSATDIESALRLALALLPNEGGSRIVLLSDGQETEGQARRMAELAAARQVELSVYPLDAATGSSQGGEVLVEQVTAPSRARQGQAVPVEVTLTATQATDATLRLFADGALAESRTVRLNSGRNRFSFSVPVEAGGFRRFRVEVEAANDTRPQNNRGEAFTTVFGPPRVLLVEGNPGEVEALAAALDAAEMETTVIEPGAMPQQLAALAVYDGLVLANVPAESLPDATQAMVAAFVRDLGRGLVMLGGPESYGAGGYLRSPLEEALPVDMEIRSQSREPNVALVLAIDKSGSMGACHCDDPDSRQQRASRVASGLPKIDIAKEAVFQATQVLGELDYLGVVAFDNAARWALETAPHGDLNAIEQAIGGLTANGQTNIFAGLSAAEESLADAPARVKHIILLTDGWSSAGAYDQLLDRFTEAGITLSVVAAGDGSAEYLQGLAENGGGKYYPATNMLEVPKIFLKETIRAAGNFVVEEPFLPAPAVAGGRAASPILRGIDLAAAPPLLGYNGSTAKDTAQVALLTPRGDPLLATWQYGLGRSAAWTSDLSGRWAQEWLAWEAFPRLAGQLVSWSLPAPGDERLDVAVATSGGEVALSADVLDETGQERNFLEVTAQILADDGTATAVELRPTGPGRYEATTTLPDEGVYLAQITAVDPTAPETSESGEPVPVAGQTTGLVVPYSPEYAALESDLTLLTDLAGLTGGQLPAEPDQLFAPTAASGRQSRPLWPLLLLVAALLFPLDVAMRRVRLGRREWQQVRSWVANRIPGQAKPSSAPAGEPLHSELFEARQRARERYSAPPPSTEEPPVSPPKPPVAEQPPSTTPEEPPAEEEQDTLARLREAKRRAKR